MHSTCLSFGFFLKNKTSPTKNRGFFTMLKDTKQQTLVRDGIPPQRWQLGVVRIWHPDLYLTKTEEEAEV